VQVISPPVLVSNVGRLTSRAFETVFGFAEKL
jgi:hypothetical protein